MNYTKRIGEITELRCRLDFVKRGIVLSQPINPDSRYDFIADIGGKIIRIQCKTCKLVSPNTISIPVVNIEPYTQKEHRYTKIEVDYFYTNWENNGYLISIDLCENIKNNKTIRLGSEKEYRKHNDSDVYSKDVAIDIVLCNINPDYSYDIIDIETRERALRVLDNDKYKCSNCGKRISKTEGLCCVCSRTSKIKPRKDELKNMIRNNSFAGIGAQYNVSDNTVRNWCKSYGLPTKTNTIIKISNDEWNMM